MSGERRTVEFPLSGPTGERIDLRRTFLSHGVAFLPPGSVDGAGRKLEITLPVRGSRPRTGSVGPGRPGYGEARGRWPEGAVGGELLARVRRVLRLDEDLSGFYGLAAAAPELARVAQVA